MSGGPPLALAILLAAAVIGGATAAVSLREGRAAILGLLVALLAAPFIADPLPDPRGLVARITGSVLAAYPLLVAIRGQRGAVQGSRGGWPADALLAITAALAGAGAAAGWDVAGQLGGSGLPLGYGQPDDSVLLAAPYLPAMAAGTAALVLAAAPVAFARDPIRLSIGLSLGVLGLTMVQAGLSGPPSALTDLCIALVLATIAAGGWAITRAARRGEDGPGAEVGLDATPFRVTGATRHGAGRSGARRAGQLAFGLAEQLVSPATGATRPAEANGTPDEAADPSQPGADPGAAEAPER